MKISNPKDKTCLPAKIFLVIFGIFLSLVILELLLRFSGMILSAHSSSYNTDEDKMRILCLGESTTAKGPHSWPEQLQDLLDNRSPGAYRVINAGRSGTNTQLILRQLDDNLEEFRPHIIITMIGINDRWSRIYLSDSPNPLQRAILKTRVFRLFSLIASAVDSAGKPACTVYQDSIEDVRDAQELLDLGRLDQAEAAFREVLSTEPGNTHSLRGLAQIYVAKSTYDPGMYESSTRMYSDLIEADPFDIEAYACLARIYGMLNKTKEETDIIMKGLSIGCKGDFDHLTNLLLTSYESDARTGLSVLKKKGFDISAERISVWNNTAHHYRQLYYALNERDIELIAMQYPTKGVDDLRDIFSAEQQKDIIFISNRENFESALQDRSYEDLFIDRFAFGEGYQFGHCTELGDRLIAENALLAVLNATEKHKD